jgi:hypothetical protein
MHAAPLRTDNPCLCVWVGGWISGSGEWYPRLTSAMASLHFLLQYFEVASAAEGHMLYTGIVTQLTKSKKWAGVASTCVLPVEASAAP